MFIHEHDLVLFLYDGAAQEDGARTYSKCGFPGRLDKKIVSLSADDDMLALTMPKKGEIHAQNRVFETEVYNQKVS